MERLALVLGNELFEDYSRLCPDENTLFFMAEDLGLCTHFKYHKHKLILFLSAMRHYRDFIEKKYLVEYHELTEDNLKIDYFTKLKDCLTKNSIKKIITYDIEDKFFREKIKNFCLENKYSLEIVSSPGFVTTNKDFLIYRNNFKRLFFTDFYIWQRKRLKILVDDSGKPINGKWSFDRDNRKKLPKDYSNDRILEITKTKYVEEVSRLVQNFFLDHPGEVDNFYLPVTFEDSKLWLKNFLEERFDNFGPYEDAFESNKVFINHSILSPLLNIGLLTPDFVLREVLNFYQSENVNFASVEGFVRQLVGWREFIRGVYNTEDFEKNFFKHTRKLTDDWYSGTTGIEPLDDSIKKAQKYGYTHHIERLMIIGNIMLLSRIDPNEVNKWFMEMYVDSLDWVMVPNVYGMSQFADGGSFATKPYIAGSNYIRKMSHYGKGDWCEILDGLYWKFIEDNRELFESNQRMFMMVRLLDNMDNNKKKIIFNKAHKFVDEKTI